MDQTIQFKGLPMLEVHCFYLPEVVGVWHPAQPGTCFNMGAVVHVIVIAFLGLIRFFRQNKPFQIGQSSTGKTMGTKIKSHL